MPLLASCGNSSNTGAGNETSYVAGDGSTIFIDSDERGESVSLAGQTLDNQPLDVKSFLGEVVVVNIWASWCAPCRSEASELAKVSKEFTDKNVQFIGLNTRDSLVAAKAFNTRFETGYPSIQDNDGKLTLAFGNLGPAATPTTILLDRQGRVAGRILGEVTEAQLRSLIKAVLEET